MRTLGLIGGTTYHSTIEYYRAINEQINVHLGGMSSAKVLLYSVNFAEFQPPSDAPGWTLLGDRLSVIAQNLERAGAECIVICANTPHMVAEVVQSRITIPLLHIADATADEVARRGIHHVALLGTKPTMEQAFFKARLAQRGITAMAPDEPDRAFLHASIFAELGKGLFKPETRDRYLALIDTLVQRGAQGVILGCTEIPLLIRAGDCPVPAFDTTALHVSAAVRFALS